MDRNLTLPDNLRNRTAPPRLGPAIVDRECLVERICGASEARVTFISAPAGSGKTVLLDQCRARLASQGVATAWLSLDAMDNDAFHFARGLLAATAHISSQDSPADAGKSISADPSNGIHLQDAMRWIGQIRNQFALILDEFEVLSEHGVFSLVSELIDSLPANGRLIIGGRTSPNIAISKLRALGLLQEIEADDLRFSVEETIALLQRSRVPALSEDDLSTIFRKTEGWAVALRLVTIALERTPDRSSFISKFSGQEAMLAEYLTDALFVRQPEEIRRFLLETSILQHVSASLCQALLPELDCVAILNKISSADIMLTPLSGESKVYRYHSLFAEFLQARLGEAAPERIPHLHRAASTWFEEHGRPIPAIDHAIKGGLFEHAIEMLESQVDQLMTDGRFRLLSGWFEKIPRVTLDAKPHLRIVYIWALCHMKGAEKASALLHSSGLEHSDDPKIRKLVQTLEPVLLAMMDEVDEAYAIIKRDMAQVPTAPDFSDKVLAYTGAMLCLTAGDRMQARAMLARGKQRNTAADTPFTMMQAETIEGHISLFDARLRQAKACFQLALESSRKVGCRGSGGNTWAGLLFANVVYEMNELDLAHQLLQVFNPIIREVGVADHMILGYLPLVRIALQERQEERAFQLLSELEYYGLERNLPRVWGTAKLERSRVQIIKGHLDAAETEIAHSGDPSVWQKVNRLRFAANELEDLTIARLRLQAHGRDPRGSLPTIDAELARAESSMRRYRALKFKVIKIVALANAGNRKQALNLLGELLRFANSERFVRTIVDEGPVMAGLVREFGAQAAASSEASSDGQFLAYLDEMRTAFHLPNWNDKTDALLDPLTEKEIRVLSFLAEGLSDVEIGERMKLSASTIRTHLRAIYSKLDVHSRMQAVLAARRAGVIH